MRPEDFSPGNAAGAAGARLRSAAGFNEAGGFLPRKPAGDHPRRPPHERASMRPEDFSPGNPTPEHHREREFKSLQ